MPIDSRASIILVDIQAVTYAHMTPDQKQPITQIIMCFT